jgi:glycosyltransferase involved in cell wall biosynthesis
MTPPTRIGLDDLRILMIVLNQVGKGTWLRAACFGQNLVEREHQVALMAMSPKSRWRLCERDMNGVRLVETPDLLTGSLRSGWDPYDTLRRTLWLGGHSFDIVHAVESRPVVLFPALAAQKRGSKLVMDWCDWFGRGGSVEERPPLMRLALRPVETHFEERFRTRADATVTINAFLRDRAIQLGAAPDSVTVIRNGCETDVPTWDRATARRAVGLPDETPLIGYVGAIYQRDAELMALAFNRVQKTLPDARLVLVGYFNRQIEPLLDRPESVIRTGWVGREEMFQYLAGCDLCWLPMCDSGTNRGRWPGKLNAYMTAARPTVATAVGDQAELIPRHRLGLVTRDDPDDLAAGVVELLTDRNRCDKIGRAARRAAEDVLSWERATDDLEAFYQRVLTGENSGAET